MSKLPDNIKRTNRAIGALAHYKQKELRECGKLCASTVTDLLTDLRHYCESDSIDFAACVRDSEVNFAAEVAEEAG